MAPMLATMALIHLSALAGLLLAAKFSVRLVDEHGRAIERREPEPRPGEIADPSAYRQGQKARPEPRWLA